MKALTACFAQFRASLVLKNELKTCTVTHTHTHTHTHTLCGSATAFSKRCTNM